VQAHDGPRGQMIGQTKVTTLDYSGLSNPEEISGTY
jgi:hypothetical protein